MRKTTWKAISIILVGIMVLQFAGPLVSPIITAIIGSVTNPNANPSPTYLGQCTRRAYIPALVLYDPPGDQSYQQITKTQTLSMTTNWHVEFSVGCLAKIETSASRSSTYECTLLESYTSSQSDSSNDMGPGKGDSIIGSVYDITWDVWLNGTNPDGSNIYIVQPTEQSLIGSFIYSRTDLAAKTTTTVPDKTGRGGAVNYYWSISANRTVEKQVTYKWGNGSTFDFAIGVDIDFGPVFSFRFMFGTGFSFSAEQTFSITSHYFDSGKRISFYESADSGFRNSMGINEVDSSVHWYSPSDDTPPDISTPPSITDYVQGSKGHNITWNAGDQHPNYYEIDRTFQSTTTSVCTSMWLFNGSITYNIVGLIELGTYTFTCRVYDMELNHASSSVNVTVIPDTTPPTINSPGDITYYYQTARYSITWIPHDDEPVRYVITRDGVVLQNQTWDGGEIPPVWVDGLAAGTYKYNCAVTDAGNNVASDEVIVTVLPHNPPGIDSPANIIYMRGTTGHYLRWHPIDTSVPGTYQVYKDGTLVQNGTWVGGTEIAVCVDGLSGSYLFPQTYYYTCYVYDAFGAYTSDTASVTVASEPPGGCPNLLVWNGSAYLDEGLLSIHNLTNPESDVVLQHVLETTPAVNDQNLYTLELYEHPAGYNVSHSWLNQVVLYVVDTNGVWHRCSLVSAVHSTDGDVLPLLARNDTKWAETYFGDKIVLQFIAPHVPNIDHFVFVLVGHNMK